MTKADIETANRWLLCGAIRKDVGALFGVSSWALSQNCMNYKELKEVWSRRSELADYLYQTKGDYYDSSYD